MGMLHLKVDHSKVCTYTYMNTTLHTQVYSYSLQWQIFIQNALNWSVWHANFVSYLFNHQHQP